MRGCARGSLPDAVVPNKKPGISAGRLMSIRRNLSGGFVLDGCVVTFGVGIVTLGIASGAAFRFSLGAAARALGELAFDFLDRLGLGWLLHPSACAPKPRSFGRQSRTAASGVDQDTRVQHALRIEFAFRATERPGKQLGPLLVVERSVEAADGMVVGGRTAMLDGGCRAGRQHFHELVEHDPLVEQASEGEVETRAVGIDVGGTASGGAFAPG